MVPLSGLEPNFARYKGATSPSMFQGHWPSDWIQTNVEVKG